MESAESNKEVMNDEREVLIWSLHQSFVNCHLKGLKKRLEDFESCLKVGLSPTHTLEIIARVGLAVWVYYLVLGWPWKCQDVKNSVDQILYLPRVIQ